MAQRGLGQHAAVDPVRQPDPQGQSAIRDRPVPLGQASTERAGQCLVAGAQPVTAPLDDIVVLGVEQRGQHRLAERLASQVGGGLNRGEPADQPLARADPPGAQTAPVQLGDRPDRDQVRQRPRRDRGQWRRRRRVAQPQFGQRDVVHEQCVGVVSGEPRDPLAAAGRLHQAGRIVMRGDQVHQCGPVGAHRVLQPVRVESVVRRDADHACAGPVQRVDHAGERGILHHGGLTGQHLAAHQQVDRLLAAGRHQHVLGRRGQGEPVGEVAGQRGAQRPQAIGEVAGRLGDLPHGGPAQHRGRVGERGGDLGGAVDGGDAQVRDHVGRLEPHGEEAVRAVHRRRGRAVRHDAGAGALTAVRHALVAEHLIGGGDRVAADRQRSGQLTLGRQAQAGGQFAGVGEPGDPAGEQPV